jgi:UDP-N-acetylmuramate dehydrogenase
VFEIQEQVNLSKYSTLGVGGKADFFVTASNTTNLVAALDWAHSKKIPFVIIGGGSNVLVSDEGFRGLVIINRAGKFKINGMKVIADSGANFSKLAMETMSLGLTGLHFGAGIPGTIGGAVVGNAGALGWDVARTLKTVLVWSDGEEKTYSNVELGFGYRTSRIKGKNEAIILSAEFELTPGDKDELEKLILNDRKRRTQSYLGRTCGSYFKNPEGDKTAGELIDQLGLKGYRVGGAEISLQHANVIRNINHAMAGDIFDLENQVIKKVKEEYDINLVPEVVKIGNFSA